MSTELDAWLKSLPGKVRRELAGVVDTQARRLSDEQKSELQGLLQPPDDGGELLNSLRVEDGRNDLEKIVVAGGEETTVDGYDHALSFEFGTQRQPPRPFFYPPYRRMRESIDQEIAAALDRAIGS